MLNRTVPIITTLALTAGSALLAGAPVQATGSAVAPTTTPTRYSMVALGYGSRVRGGDVPAGSDRSAFQVIGCTNRAGLNRTNAEAIVDLGQGLKLSAVKTHVWTTKVGRRVSSWASNRISEATLGNVTEGDPTANGLIIRGIYSRARAWHSPTGFHARTNTKIAQILVVAAGVRTVFPLPPAPGDAVTIPDLASIEVNRGTTRTTAHWSRAAVDAVTLTVIGTGTVAQLAHSAAKIHDGVLSSLFGGSAYGTKVQVLGGPVTSGPTPLIVMPCQGTNGRLRIRSIDHTNLGGEIRAHALTARQRAGVRNGVARVFERAEVGRIRLSDQLVVKAIVGRAHVVRTAGGYLKDVKGTSIGSILVNGELRQMPPPGVLEIPGVAKLVERIVHRSRRGIEVTALRVILLDGSLKVINLGHARVRIAPSGL